MDGCLSLSVLINLLYAIRNLLILSKIGMITFFWVDDFACPARFPWHTAKNVTRDPAPIAADFNAQDYATLVAHPSLFRKFPEELLCLVGLSRHYTLDEETYLLFLDKNREVLTNCLMREVVAPRRNKEIPPVVGVGKPRRQKKKKTIVADASGPSHPPKKLREDHGTPSGASVGGKSRSTVQRLFVGVMQNVEVRDSSHHSGANITKAERKLLNPLYFSSTLLELVELTAMGGFTDLTGSDFLVGGIRTIISPDTDLQKVYVPQWSVTNGSRLDDGRVCREMVDEFAPHKFVASIREIEHNQLFTEFKVGAARQMSLSAEVRTRAVVLKEAEAAKAICLRAETSKLEAVKKSLQDEVQALKGRNATLEKEKNDLNVKVADLAASFKVKEHEVAGLDAVVTYVRSQNDNLVEQVSGVRTTQKPLCAENGAIATLWNSWVPKKVNMLISRALKGRLSVREELDIRGIDLDSLLCPCCNNVVESCNHSLILCNFAVNVWEKVLNWLRVGNVSVFSIGELFSSCGNVFIPNLLIRLWQAVIWTSGYYI
uniref:RNA-directed DNA polymerase, eukaryota n=1 Tax=Tanacetum cinerariifolium TaxID=118510 RepID=A0A6L2NZR4_TANCI|nr:RNA-directed DNA polymerase, eukaryota [Tanacetum cinerariifolium]